MLEWFLLFILGFVVSAWNSTIGPTGGALIAGTTLVVPPPGSLLLQGVAALFSNGFRSWKMRQYLDTKVLLPFLLGTLLAIAPAYFLFSKINNDVWMIAIGFYVLLAGSLSFYKKRWGMPLFPAGFISAIASFLTGTGSLVAAPSVRRYTEDRLSLISNESFLVFLQGFIKTILLLLAFTLPDNFFFLLSALLASMLLGNIIGLKLLEKIPDKVQGRLQMIVVIVLGLAVIVKGVF